MSKLVVVPMGLREANDFVAALHRHNGRTARDGGKFAIGCVHDEVLCGVAIVGRPISRILADAFTVEVLRLCVTPDAPKGACSFLYARCWRVWQMMGGRRMITYTLQSESGASLRGAGWKVAGETRAQNWDRADRPRRHQAVYEQPKLRWEVET